MAMVKATFLFFDISAGGATYTYVIKICGSHICVISVGILWNKNKVYHSISIMNPSTSRSYWNNPPPPGTEFDSPEEDSNSASAKVDRPIDRIDPYLKNPAYIGREREYSSERSRYRSRSKSTDHRRHRKRSRSRHRRSRSRSHRRRRRYSSSRSRSRSHSPGYHSNRHKRSRNKRRSPSRSRSRSPSRSRYHRSERDKRSPRVKREPSDEQVTGDLIKEEDMKIDEEEEEAESDPAPIPFKNDGSFLEMFKKMQEQQKVKEEPPEEAEAKKPVMPVFGKRRGGKVLKTGMVQKVRNREEESATGQDAWSVYMKEVRRYKEACCDDDSKTRPLVK